MSNSCRSEPRWFILHLLLPWCALSRPFNYVVEVLTSRSYVFVSSDLVLQMYDTHFVI